MSFIMTFSYCLLTRQRHQKRIEPYRNLPATTAQADRNLKKKNQPSRHETETATPTTTHLSIVFLGTATAPRTHRTVQKPACNNGAGRQKPKAKNQPSGRSTETQHPPQPTYQLYFSEPLTVLERCDCTETAPTHFFTYQLSFSERVMAKETFGTDGWVDGVDFFGGRNLDFSQKNCIITIDLTTQVKPI